MKKEMFCIECDAHFTINMERGFEIKFCPNCGEAMSQDDVNDILNEDE